MAAAFDTWREAAGGARDKKKLAAECVERWRLWRVWGAWEVWREVVERRKEDKAAMQQVSFKPVSSEQSFHFCSLLELEECKCFLLDRSYQRLLCYL